MKKFTRQTSGNAPPANINLDFGAAGAKVARLFEPGEYRLRIDSARIIQNNQNVSVVLNLIEMARIRLKARQATRTEPVMPQPNSV